MRYSVNQLIRPRYLSGRLRYDIVCLYTFVSPCATDPEFSLFLFPYKVEDYYKIIEEPMDFGTMRAKLHEGMYSSLEQFEV